MVKRIIKILAIVIACSVVVIGGVIGVVALRGGFNEEVINITKLYFGEDETAVTKEFRTLEDVVANINFQPKNATNKTLQVEVLGNENGVIGNLTEVTAGKDFTLDVRQDSKGNNIGGVVTIVASQGIAEVKMTVVVDVNIPNNALFFTGDDSGKITTSGKTFTMAISDKTQYVYLKSNLVNAFFLQANNENLKNTDISYEYRKEDGTIINENVSSKSTIERKYNAHENRYNYFYKIPLVTDQAGKITMTAKMHRTSEIERIFVESKFANLPTLLKNQNNSAADREAATLTLSKYNDFLNKYIKYFDTSSESYAFFKNTILSDGRITLSSLSQVQESFNYVFVSTDATINVTAIKLEDFSSMTTPREYDVTLAPGDEVLFSVSGNSANNIVDDFGLMIKTDNDDAVGSDAKKDYMFESLAVKPYLYLDINSVPVENLDEGNGLITWTDRQYKFTTVYGFDGHSPIITRPSDSPEVKGYLLLLESQDEYISITQLQVNEEKHWKLSCNVPMAKDQNTDIYKALYLGFEVSGIGTDTNSMVTIESFTRIYVNYEDLEFTYSDVNNIAINTLDKYMSINTSDIEINETSSYYNQLTVGRYTQDITNNITNANVDNLSTATYQNVMYFAETTSNKIDSEYSKVATVGRYNFINYNNANTGNPSYYMYGEEELIGERIATYKLVNNEKRYYLHALNASTTPVQLFAVVYLSDKNGNPIDVNGRRIVIDESQTGETANTLVVLRISEITEEGMPSVYVESYVENINFYTKANNGKVIQTIGSPVEGAATESVQFEQGYLNRNHLNYYVDENGDRISDELLDLVQDYLTLKLLKNNYFTLYITNFDLANDGSVNLCENTLTEVACKDITGKTLSMGYSIYNHYNKQIAFNAMCADLNNYTLYTDSQQVKVFGTPKVMSVDGEWEPGVGMNATMIRFVLHSSKDDNANTDPKIYLNPENSSIPYSKNLIYSEGEGSQQIQRNNFVIYHTNKLEISDVSLDNAVTLQNKLYAKYANKTDGVEDGDLTFNYSLDGGSSQYALPIVNGNVAYVVHNNLMSENKSNEELVDCSQTGTIDRPDKADMDGVYFYDSLESYIAYYTTLPNASAITYTTADSIISLEEDVYFTNVLQEKSTKFINFGTKQFEFIDAGVIGTVDINGFDVKIKLIDSDKNIWQMTIPKGTIFPLVNGNKALIYNEVFEVSTSDYVNYYIKDYVNNELGISGKSIKVNKTANVMLSNGQTIAYDASKYLDDTVSAIVKIGLQGDSSATVNFLQGEELGRFVEDANGTYKKVVDKTNENIYTYELLDGTEDRDIQKYSISGLDEEGGKIGVKVYMIVTIPFIYNDIKDAYEYTFYKAIEYELLQEEIKVIGYNTPGNTEEVINTNINPLKVNAGESTTIILGAANNSGAYISIKANNENYFFQHVDFSITSTTMNVISSVEDDNKSITVTVPDLVSNDTFVIQMEYIYKNKTEKFKFYVEAEANIKFKNDVSVPIKDISASEKAYVISLDAGTKHTVNEIFNNTDWFDIDDKISLITISDGSVSYSGTNEFELPDVNAEFDGTNIKYGSKIYTIYLKIGSKGEQIQLNYKLYIEIVPTYLIDATTVEDNVSITIYNGDELYAEYIKLYNGNLTVSELANNASILPSNNEGYNSVYTLTTDSDTLALLDATAFAKGQIKLKSTPTTDTTLQLSLKYTTYNGTTITHNFSVVVRGINMKYSPTGTIATGTDAKVLDRNIEIEVPQDTTSIDITKYLSFALSNTDETSEAVTAVLLNSSGESVYTITNPSDGDVYTIAYMKSSTGNVPKLVGSVGYTFTIRLVTV